MIRWFADHAPIRTKFNVLTLLYASYFGAALAAVVWHKSTGTGGNFDIEVMAGAMVATIVTALVSKKLICDPYVTTVVRMEGLAAGDLSSPVRFMDNRDCVGRMTTAMSTFRENAERVQRAAELEAVTAESQRRVVGALGMALRSLAEGKMDCAIREEFPAEFASLRSDFNQAVEVLSHLLSTVTEASQSVRTGSDEIRKASDDLSNRTEKQAASLEETSAALNQMTETVRQTAADAVLADESTRRAREEALKSGETVRSAIAAMSGIERASREISEIISVIDGISFQTNLLALNAGVEAARAGDAGKGFAVVASEVRALAQRSADAAKDITARISASGKEVEAGVQLVGAAGEALERIIRQVEEVSDLVSTIATGAEKQSEGLLQINDAVNDMDRVTQQNAAMVEEATAAAHSLGREASDLSEQMARFSGMRDAPAPVRNAPPVAVRPVAAATPQRKFATVGNAALAVDDDEDWAEF